MRYVDIRKINIDSGAGGSRYIRAHLEVKGLWPPPFGQTYCIRGLQSAAGKSLNGRIVHMGRVDKETGRLCVWF